MPERSSGATRHAVDQHRIGLPRTISPGTNSPVSGADRLSDPVVWRRAQRGPPVEGLPPFWGRALARTANSLFPRPRQPQRLFLHEAKLVDARFGQVEKGLE